MEKVWLSTTYYTDDKFDGISATTERMFSRLLALAGSLENEGVLPQKPWVFVGLPNGNRSVSDLVSRNILEVLPDGRYRFAAWAGWQKEGDDLARLRKSNRDRKRRQREREAQEQQGESRDMSRDVTRADQTRPEEIDSHVSKASHVSDAHARDERPSGPPIQPTAAKLVRDIVPREYPSAVKTDLRIRASELLNGGTDADIVREALERWIAKSGVGPGILPSLVVDVLKERDPATHTHAAPGTTGGRQLTKRERQFIDLELQKDHPDPRVLAQYGLPPDTSSAALRAIPGGKA
ncbi:helix-turn-helix DNA binding domain protein [Gordonia phage RavenCo17]|nr:helix-turn-helix DNA binding domain protein [Gordonia phage RavenCo17]